MKRILFQSTFWRSFFIQSTWNFERMQNVGFVFSLLPFFRKLYPYKNERRHALLRHMGFFNTHPYMVSIILGIVASMENDIVEKKSSDYTEMDTLKTNMAGPLAAIGDTFFWATWRPFTALLAASLIFFFHHSETFRGTWLAPLFFLVSFNLVHLSFRYWSLRLSYHLRARMIRIIAGLEFQKAIDIVQFAGLIVLAVIVLFYTLGFGHSLYERALFVVFFLATVLLGCLRIPASVMFYIIILSGMAITWLHGKI